jgi:hypothetical protein
MRKADMAQTAPCKDSGVVGEMFRDPFDCSCWVALDLLANDLTVQDVAFQGAQQYRRSFNQIIGLPGYKQKWS